MHQCAEKNQSFWCHADLPLTVIRPGLPGPAGRGAANFYGNETFSAQQIAVGCLHNGFFTARFGLMIDACRACAWREFWCFEVSHNSRMPFIEECHSFVN